MTKNLVFTYYLNSYIRKKSSIRILIFTWFLLFANHDSRSGSIVAADFYAEKLTPTLYEFHADVLYKATSSPSYLRVYWYSSFLPDTLLLPDTSWQISPSFYKAIYTFKHSFPLSGTFKIYFELANWNADILNILDAVNQPVGDTVTIANIPFIGLNQFNGFVNDAISGTWTGNDFTHDLSINEPDGDSIVIQQVSPNNLVVPMVYQFPSSLVASAENLSPPTYECNDVSIPGKLLASFEIREYRYGYLMAKHNRNITFEYGATDLEELNNLKKISIYPNPASTFIRIHGDGSFCLWDSFGQKLKTLIQNENDISHLSPGIYFVINENGYSQKFIKE